MNFTVIVHEIVTVEVQNVEADSHKAAIDAALTRYDCRRLNRLLAPGCRATAADRIDGFLVEEPDDPTHSRSQWYDADGRPI